MNVLCVHKTLMLKNNLCFTAIAGNIIPAIATANAIIAGLVVLHAFRVLAEEYSKMQSIYLRQKPNHRNMILVPERNLTPANPKCYVCSPHPTVNVCVDTVNMTVKEFETEILKKGLNMIAPDVMLEGQSLVVISSEEGETEQNDSKRLNELGIVDGSILKADDFLQNYELTININQYQAQEKDDPTYKIVCDPDQLRAKEDDKVNGSNGVKKTDEDGQVELNKKSKLEEDEDDDDDLCIVENEGASASKKMKMMEIDDTPDLIMIDD